MNTPYVAEIWYRGQFKTGLVYNVGRTWTHIIINDGLTVRSIRQRNTGLYARPLEYDTAKAAEHYLTAPFPITGRALTALGNIAAP